MNLQLLFWVLYLIALVFSLYQNRTAIPAWAGGSLIQFILIGVLGWAVFGAAVHR
jgi:TctA family transporter